MNGMECFNVSAFVSGVRIGYMLNKALANTGYAGDT
jgi:hypothetical protein